MDTPDRRPVPVLHPPPRRRRRPRRYLSHLAPPPDAPPDPPRAPAASAVPVPLLRRVLSGLRALPDAPAATVPTPSADHNLATLADLTRRLLAWDPSLGAPPEEREPSPDVVVTQELPVVGGPVVGGPAVLAEGGVR